MRTKVDEKFSLGPDYEEYGFAILHERDIRSLAF
jgi:hypothetical protein